MRTLAVLALLVGSPVAGKTLCAGSAAIEVGDLKTSTQRGPDFTVWYVGEARGQVGIYSGCCSEVHNDKQTKVLSRDGVAIFRTVGKSGFSGYLAIVKSQGGWVTETHFFGPKFQNGAQDLEFLKQVRFGSAAAKLCPSESRG